MLERRPINLIPQLNDLVKLLERPCPEAGSYVIDWVLSDVIMPQRGGIDLLYAMKQQGMKIPALMMTGHLLDEDLAHLQVPYSVTDNG